jgi:Tol biopolymer transport system component/DNA-binding winged helix-turn-helix (wHTH) protein
MPGVLEFGPFALDLDRYELRRAGRSVRLQRVPMELLILLVERRGGLLTRDEIIARLWTANAEVDTELGLNTAIRKVRRALGDHADRPRFVETVVGKGYRFMAAVTEPPGVVVAPVAEEPVPTNKWRPVIVWPALAAVTILAVSMLLLARPPRRAEAMRVSPFTALPGLESGPSFSPDGAAVAFAWTGESGEVTNIYRKAVGSDAPVRLTAGGASDSNPSWSPDGSSIAFLRVDERQAMSVMVIPANGGPERRVGRLAGSRRFRPAWSPDGKALAVLDSEPPDAPPGILLLSIETGEKRRLTDAVAASAGDGSPGYSPDGSSLAFLRNIGSIGSSVVVVLPVDRTGMAKGPQRQIATDRANFIDFDWSADGRSLICTTQSAMVRIPVSGGSSEELPFPNASQLSVSRRGNRMVYAGSVRDTDIFRVAGPDASGAVEKLISSTRLDGAPQYSADGTRIAFVSQRTGSDGIWVAGADGREVWQAASLPRASLGCPRWSPDGSRIAFDSTQDGRAHIYVTGVHGGDARRITSGDSVNVRPSWSRDGRWIYFGSDRSGAWEIWKTAPGGGEPVRVTRSGGREAFEDRLGRYLYYTRQRPIRGIWRIPVSGGIEEPVADMGSQGRWAVGGRGLYYLNDRGDLELSEFDRGRRVVIPTRGLQMEQGSGGLLAVGPEDRWILVTAQARTESGLTLVEGFR